MGQWLLPSAERNSVSPTIMAPAAYETQPDSCKLLTSQVMDVLQELLLQD
jgi:hypothetical protein